MEEAGTVSSVAQEGEDHRPSSSSCIQLAMEQLGIMGRLVWGEPIGGENERVRGSMGALKEAVEGTGV